MCICYTLSFSALRHSFPPHGPNTRHTKRAPGAAHARAGASRARSRTHTARSTPQPHGHTNRRAVPVSFVFARRRAAPDMDASSCRPSALLHARPQLAPRPRRRPSPAPCEHGPSVAASAPLLSLSHRPPCAEAAPPAKPPPAVEWARGTAAPACRHNMLPATRSRPALLARSRKPRAPLSHRRLGAPVGGGAPLRPPRGHMALPPPPPLLPPPPLPPPPPRAALSPRSRLTRGACLPARTPL